jgi:hypothetical protein
VNFTNAEVTAPATNYNRHSMNPEGRTSNLGMNNTSNEIIFNASDGTGKLTILKRQNGDAKRNVEKRAHQGPDISSYLSV